MMMRVYNYICSGVTVIDKKNTYFSQGIYLFSVMAESTALQKLSLDGNDLSMVPPEHVAKGTNRLREVSLSDPGKPGVHKHHFEM